MDDGAAAAGTGMCRLRRSVRPVGRDEGIREAGGLPGEKTFGDFWSFKSHSPSRAAAAKPRRGQRPRILHGEAMPSKRWMAFRRRMTLAPLTLPSPPRGERIRPKDAEASRQANKKTAAPGLRFFYWVNLLAPGTNGATGLRHGASWFCRRCLPAQFPSR